MTPSRRSSVASTHTRSSFTFPSRKSSQLPTVSYIHAEPEQPSTPPTGSAAAQLSPRISTQGSQKKLEDEEMVQEPEAEARKGDGEAMTRSDSAQTAPAATQIDGDTECQMEDVTKSVKSRATIGESSKSRKDFNELQTEKPGVRKSKSWFTFRRQPSKLSLTAAAEETGKKVTEAQYLQAQSPSPEANASPASGTSIDGPQRQQEPEQSPPAAPIPIKSPNMGNPRSATGSWFGSLSKTQTQIAQTEADSGPACGLTPLDNGRSIPSSPESKATSGQSIWFTPQNAPRPPLEHIPSGPSSMDVKTPVQQEPPMVPAMISAPEMELVSAIQSEVKLSALNPSTSRFAIAAPLLGRPKVPLKTVVSRKETAQSEKVALPATTGSENEISNERSPVSASTTTSENPTISSEATTEVNTSSSWWGYLGFGGAAASAITEVTAVPEVQTQPDVVIEDPIAEQSATEAASEAEEDRDEIAGTANPPAQSDNVIETSIEQAASLASGQTTASAWYNPWGWYQWYSTSSATVETPEGTSTAKTEAELIKEEALSRADASRTQMTTERPSDPPSEPAPTATSDRAPEPLNPILASLTANPSGWTSFFSSRSRSLTTKAVTETGERESRESMEVMDIDDYEDASAGEAKDSHVKTSQVGGDGKATTKDIKQMDSLPRSPDSVVHTPLTTTDDVKRKAVNNQPDKRSSSPTPSKKSTKSTKSNVPAAPRPANLVLPTFEDTFFTAPRSQPPPKSRSSASSAFFKTMGFVSSVLFAREEDESSKRKGKQRERHPDLEAFGKELPRAWKVLGEAPNHSILLECKKIVVIGVHGWFPGYAMRTVLGEPTGTSKKFANMMALALRMFSETQGIEFEKITKIPLEGEGKIKHRVDRLYQNLTSNDEWMEALHAADVIFVVTHSQGCIVSTHLISRLISDGHIRTAHSNENSVLNVVASVASGTGAVPDAVPRRVQRVCCLGLCGIHLGPLAYLQKSSLVMPYIQYFESEAAAELFEFQHTESSVSKEYVEAVRHVLSHEVKSVYIASLNDQVVPVYSGVFTSASHPLILRALYMDGDAYHSSDFLSNLLVLLLRIRNAGLSDGGLLAHLSEATRGSLNGVGHSTAYEDIAAYTLAVEYLFLTNDGQDGAHELVFEPFNARDALNDYEIPWALRDLIADERVVHLFSKEFAELRDAFGDWHPRTSILRDLKRKLEPIRRLRLASRL